jgi:polysaccharide biosynthesis transport protein
MHNHSSSETPDHGSRAESRRARAAPDGPPGGLAVESVYAREIFSIVRRHLWLVLGAPVVALVCALFILQRQEPVYRASALILIKDYRREVAGGIEDATNEKPVGRFSDALLSQIELLRGRVVLGEVVDREGLRLVSLSPEFSVSQLTDLTIAPEAPDDTIRIVFRSHEFEVRTPAAGATARYGAAVSVAGVSFSVPAAPPVPSALLLVSPREREIDRLLAGIQTRPRSQTDAVEISFTAVDPKRAQRVANSLVQTFQASSAGAAQRRSERRRTFLEAQLHATDSVLAGAQLALSGFRSREAVYSSRERITAQQQGLMTLQMRRAELDADYRMYRSVLSGLEGPAADRNLALRTLVSSPEIASNEVVSRLYALLVQYRTEREALTTGPLASTGSHPDVARLSGLVAATESNLMDAVESHVAALAGRIRALDGLMVRGAAEIQQLPRSEAEEVRLVQQAETYRRLADQLREDLQKARIAEAVEAGQVEIVHLAPLPGSPIWRGRRKLFGLALALGLFVGVTVPFGLEVMNSSIRRREEIEAVLNIPQLAVIPRLSADTNGRRRPRILEGLKTGQLSRESAVQPGRAIEDPRAPGAVAYRMLRLSLGFTRAPKSVRSLLVTSAEAGEGKTTTASHLAITFARAGQRVLLVDCDLQNPSLHRVFGLPLQPGVTEMIRAGSASDCSGLSTHVEGLDLLPAGESAPDTAESLSGDQAQSALEVLAERYDLLVIDTSPVLHAAETLVLASRVDEVLLVVRAGRTDREVAQYALRQLERAGANVVGGVLNDADRIAESYGRSPSRRYA